MRSKPSSFETLCDILYLLIMIALSVNLLLKDGFGNPESRIYHLAGFMVAPWWATREEHVEEIIENMRLLNAARDKFLK